MNKVLYLVMKKSPYDRLSLFRKICYKINGGNKEDIFIGFTNNKLIAKIYLTAHDQDDFYIREISKTNHEYELFSTENKLNEIKCFKLENGEDLLVMTKKEKMQYCAKGVKFYDRFK